MHFDRFSLITDSISIGDGTMDFARFRLSLLAGTYCLVRGALTPPPPHTPAAQVISLDSPFVFVLDSSLEEAFGALFHDIAGPMSYDITRVLERHAEFESALGARVAFYWEGQLNGSGEYSEGSYILDPRFVAPASEA